MSTDDYDPIKNPRPEDLNAYGITNALVWFAGLIAVGALLYFVATKMF